MSKHSSSNIYFRVLTAVGIFVVLALGLAVTKRDVLLSKFKNAPAKTAITYPVAQPRNYEKPIALPKPKLTGNMAVENAIQQRRSRREFSNEPVTMAELSQLLWAAQGITDPETGHRTAPSARESYPFTVFVVVRNVSGLTPGLYEYLPKEHSLGDLKLANAGEMLNTSGVQPGAQAAPVVFALSASYGKAQKTLGDSVVSSSMLEAGHIGQNMYLQTESLKMGMVVMAGFDAKKVGAALKLDPAETIVYVMPFGHPAPEKTEAKTVLGVTDATHLFSAEELAQYDGKDGHKTYFAYEGKVYDVSGSKQWTEGEHYKLLAGKDLTGMLGEAPHGTEIFGKFPVVGTFASATANAETAVNTAPASSNNQLYYLMAGVLVVLAVAVMIGMSMRGKKA